MKKLNQATTIYYIYCGVTALLFIMMKTVREIYRVDIAEFNAFQIVIVGTTLEITHLLFEVPTGIIADKYSRKLSIIIGLVLIGSAILLEGLLPIFLLILGTQLFLGIGDTFTSGADEAWIADELNGENMTPVFLKGAQIGQFLSIFGTILGIIFGYHYIRLPYFISGSIFILLALFLLIFMKEINFKKEKSTLSHFHHMKQSLTLVISLIKQKKVLVFMVVITFMHGLYSEGIDRLWTPHFKYQFNLPDKDDVLWIGSISLCAMSLSIIAVQYIKKRLARTNKLDRVWLLFIINLLMVVTLFSFAMTKHFYISASLYIIFYTVRRINRPIYRAWMNEYIPSNIRATVLSSYGQLDSIGQIIGGPIIGLIAVNTSYSFGILFASILLTPVVFIYLYFIKRVIKYKEDAL